jgi:hypothetical protein
MARTWSAADHVTYAGVRYFLSLTLLMFALHRFGAPVYCGLWGRYSKRGRIRFRNREFWKILDEQNVRPFNVPVNQSTVATAFPLPPKGLLPETDQKQRGGDAR